MDIETSNSSCKDEIRATHPNAGSNPSPSEIFNCPQSKHLCVNDWFNIQCPKTCGKCVPGIYL